MEYQPKVGDSYTDGEERISHSIEYTITKIDGQNVHLSWFSPARGNDTGVTSITAINDKIKCDRIRFVKSDEIEVGDIVSTGGSNIEWIVTSINKKKDSLYVRNSSGTLSNVEGKLSTNKLVRKGNMKKEQEIIGYELLRDLPQIPNGVRSTPYMGKGRGGVIFAYDTKIYSASESELEDRDWYKPFYKPQEILVNISNNRTIDVGVTHVFLKGVGNISHTDVAQLYKLVTQGTRGTTTALVTGVVAVSVGCQEFTKNDILAVYQCLIDNKYINR